MALRIVTPQLLLCFFNHTSVRCVALLFMVLILVASLGI
jgi:hypothetical protein